MNLPVETILRPGRMENLDRLESLTRPLGVFCCYDRFGRELLDEIAGSPWRVPEDFAVLGVDACAHICEGGVYTLSSVPTEGATVGYRAVQTVAAMARGASPEFPILIPPGPVVARQSTDLIQTDQPRIAEAIRYLRTHACAGVNVSECRAGVRAFSCDFRPAL